MTAESNQTKREINSGAEKWLGVPIPILDQGSVMLINYMGSDDSIADAARTSYQTGTRKITNSRGLIRNLMRNDHTSPFEMAELTFRLEMPLYVLAQLSRHRTAKFVNENHESGRYSILEHKFYIPEAKDIGIQSKKNKQGRGEAVNMEVAEEFRSWSIGLSEISYAQYEHFLNDDGTGHPEDPNKPMIARELARMGLPQNLYTKLVWKCDLHNLLHFLQLRIAPDAQMEIRAYANKMAEIVNDSFPLCWEAFNDYRLNAIRLSSPEQNIISGVLKKRGIVVTEAEILEALDKKEIKSVDEREGLVTKFRDLGLID